MRREIDKTAWPAITIPYKNYRGEISKRHIFPKFIWYGNTEWHKENQFFLNAFDLEKSEHRDFAMSDIQFWDNRHDA